MWISPKPTEANDEQAWWKDWNKRNRELDMNQRAVKKADLIDKTWDIRERIEKNKGTSSELVNALTNADK